MDLIAQLARELNLKAANVEAAVKLTGRWCWTRWKKRSRPTA